MKTKPLLTAILLYLSIGAVLNEKNVKEIEYVECGDIKCAKHQGNCQEINNEYFCISIPRLLFYVNNIKL